MIDSGALAGFLRIGFFVGGCGLLMLFVQPPNTAEWVLSACSAMMGAMLVAGVIAVMRWSRRKSL